MNENIFTTLTSNLNPPLSRYNQHILRSDLGRPGSLSLSHVSPRHVVSLSWSHIAGCVLPRSVLSLSACVA